jgi:hypothetical protein
VKICNLYGDGFYYIPGTDICLKLGGYVRAQFYYDYGASATNTPFFAPNFLDTRTGGQTDFTMRTRSLISVDTRQQTEYGVLRTYFTVGHTGDSPALEAAYVNRASSSSPASPSASRSRSSTSSRRRRCPISPPTRKTPVTAAGR